MYVIIVGRSAVSRHLISLLDAEDHEVVVIEKDPALSKAIAYDYDVITVNGDATNLNTLKKAGIDHADVFLALTDDDESNLIMALIAKQAGVKTVAVILRKISYQKDVFDKLGIDYVIQPDYAAAGYIAQLITDKDILDLSFFSMGDAGIVESVLKKDSKHIGLHISKFKTLLPEDTNIIGYFKSGDFNVYKDTDTLEEGQKILIVAKKEKIKEVKKLI